MLKKRTTLSNYINHNYFLSFPGQTEQSQPTYAKILLLIPFYRKRLLQLCQILPYVCNLSKCITLSNKYLTMYMIVWYNS